MEMITLTIHISYACYVSLMVAACAAVVGSFVYFGRNYFF